MHVALVAQLAASRSQDSVVVGQEKVAAEESKKNLTVQQ
jgi:hypothetical protein